MPRRLLIAVAVLSAFASCREATRGRPSAELGVKADAAELSKPLRPAPALPADSIVVVCTEWPGRAERCDGWVRPRKLAGAPAVTGAQLHAVVRLQTTANTIPRLVGRPAVDSGSPDAWPAVSDAATSDQRALLVVDAGGRLAVRLAANLDAPP